MCRFSSKSSGITCELHIFLLDATCYYFRLVITLKRTFWSRAVSLAFDVYRFFCSFLQYQSQSPGTPPSSLAYTKMVFHVIPALAVAATKYVIKEITDAPTCDECGKEKMKMWAGMRIIFLCEDCEDGKTAKMALRALKILTLGVCFASIPEVISTTTCLYLLIVAQLNYLSHPRRRLDYSEGEAGPPQSG